MYPPHFSAGPMTTEEDPLPFSLFSSPPVIPSLLQSAPPSPPITTVYSPTTNSDTAVDILSRIAEQNSENLRLNQQHHVSAAPTTSSTTITTTSSLSQSPLSPLTSLATIPTTVASTTSTKSLKKTPIFSSDTGAAADSRLAAPLEVEKEKAAEENNFCIKTFDSSSSDSDAPPDKDELALKENHARCELEGVVVEGTSDSKEFSEFVSKRSLETFFSRIPSNFENYLDNIGELLNFLVTMHQKCATVHSKLKERYGVQVEAGKVEFGCFLCPKHCPCAESPSYKFAGRPSTRNKNGPGRRPKKSSSQVKKSVSKPPLKRARKQKVKSKEFVEETENSTSNSSGED